MSPLHPHIIAVLGNSHCFMTFEHMLYMIMYKILQYLLVSGKKYICHKWRRKMVKSKHVLISWMLLFVCCVYVLK